MSDKYYTYALSYPESMGGTIFYIGKGKGRRIDAHEAELRAGYSYNSYKERVIRKIWANGEQIVKRKLAEFDTNEEASMYEIALIFFLPNLTNLTKGGEGAPGRIVSEATRQKVSASQKGIPRKPLSREALQKIAEKNKGRKMTEANRLKLIECNTGRIVTEETRRKISKTKTGRRLKPHSEEVKRKRGEAIREAGKKRKEENPDYKYPPRSLETRQLLREKAKARAETVEGKMILDKARELSIISRRNAPSKKLSDEQRQEISVRVKAWAQTPEGKQSLDKARQASIASKKKNAASKNGNTAQAMEKMESKNIGTQSSVLNVTPTIRKVKASKPVKSKPVKKEPIRAVLPIQSKPTKTDLCSTSNKPVQSKPTKRLSKEDRKRLQVEQYLQGLQDKKRNKKLK